MNSKYFNETAAYLVHLFTASGALVGLLALNAVYHLHYLMALWLMGVAIIIDAVDGTFARLFKVKKVLPQVDGALLDNIVDYLNYVVVPACFLLTSPLLPHGWRLIGAGIVLIASAYQFCQMEAKTPDHFFKGFPSYWNIVIFYLFFWQTQPYTNLIIIIFLTCLIFVPIKYVYPSRMDYLTHNALLRKGMLLATLLWGFSTFGLLWLYPQSNEGFVFISSSYLILYGLVSFYRTFVPLKKASSQVIG